MAKDRGLVHVYYGNGKGKTTAAFGLAFRCAGNGFDVIVAQFLKSRATGEVMAAERFPEITVLRGHPLKKFTWTMNDEEKEELRKNCEELFRNTIALASEKAPRLLILDEAVDVCAKSFLPMESMTDFLDNKPESLEIVLTGHSLPDELSVRADYVSNIISVKHPYEQGIKARRGIEY